MQSQSGEMNTNCFPDFWENCLGITLNGYFENPQLHWFEHPTIDVLGYRIYRAWHDSGPAEHPESLSYSIIDSTNFDTFNYIDGSVRYNGEDYYYYYVKGFYGRFHQFETQRTNIIGTVGGLYKKNQKPDLTNIRSNNLKQNSPNPFNPSTVISYQIASDSYITLKVFDLLGREITTLAEGFKPAGKYETVFSVGSFGNAEDLPSGTYIYTLNVNGKAFSKKMQVLK